MKITKFGHCCLLIEENGVRMMIDPGSYSILPEDVNGIDALIFTHDHQDHLDFEKVKILKEANPKIRILTCGGAKEKLTEAGIDSELLSNSDKIAVGDVSIEGFGNEHSLIHANWPRSKNTGVLIAEKFFFPGDSFTIPNKSVEILALPVAGPWMKLGEAIDYALAIKPKVAFPVHEAMLRDDRMGSAHRIPSDILLKHGIEFRILPIGKSVEL